MTDLLKRICDTIERQDLARPETPVLLMVSGGSDSTALAHIAARLSAAGAIGALAMLHVNHHLRGADSDGDAQFVAATAEALGIPLFMCDIDVAALVEAERGNMEAIARRERYAAARDALRSLRAHTAGAGASGVPAGVIFTAHTQDDRVENFYMRSIVGTGPGGFRSMTYRTGAVARPLLDVSRDDLREFLFATIECPGNLAAPLVDGEGGLPWREDKTNAGTDHLRSYVRHALVPVAKQRNPRLLDTLCRTMNLIADEDDFLAGLAGQLQDECVTWIDAGLSADAAGGTGAGPADGAGPATNAGPAAGADPAADAIAGTGSGADASSTTGAGPAADAGPADGAPFAPAAGCLIAPRFSAAPLVVRRRAVKAVLQELLGEEERVENASIEAVLAAWPPSADAGLPSHLQLGSTPAPAPEAFAAPISGYVINIQGNLAVSANKRGVRIEPMDVFRARRKKRLRENR